MQSTSPPSSEASSPSTVATMMPFATSTQEQLENVRKDLAVANELCDHVRTSTAAQDFASALAAELASCPELASVFVNPRGGARSQKRRRNNVEV